MISTKICKLLVLILFGCVVGCSSPNDNPVAATQVASQWVETNIDQISGKLLDSISSEISTFAKPVLTTFVKKGLKWEYFPEKVGRDQWRVKVRVSNSFDLSTIGISKIASAYGDIQLNVDTKKLQVNNFDIDPHNFSSSLVDKTSK